MHKYVEGCAHSVSVCSLQVAPFKDSWSSGLAFLGLHNVTIFGPQSHGNGERSMSEIFFTS